MTVWRLVEFLRKCILMFRDSGQGAPDTHCIFVGLLYRFGSCADSVNTAGSCSGLQICVNQGTTFETILRVFFGDEFIVPRQSGALAAEGLATGVCNAIAGGVIDVSLSNVRANLYEGDYEIGTRRFSKDPLALVTRPDDPYWSDYVFWIVSALFYAEEEGITAATANRMPITNLFGPLHTRMFRDAVSAVGSYADIYAQHVEAEVPRGNSLNSLNESPYGGQHYPLPGLV